MTILKQNKCSPIGAVIKMVQSGYEILKLSMFLCMMEHVRWDMHQTKFKVIEETYKS